MLLMLCGKSVITVSNISDFPVLSTKSAAFFSEKFCSVTFERETKAIHVYINVMTLFLMYVQNYDSWLYGKSNHLPSWSSGSFVNLLIPERP